jgi:hypothetical protein
MTSSTVNATLNFALQTAWPILWPIIAQDPKLLRLKSDDHEKYHTALDPLMFVNPTTQAQTYGFSIGSCDCTEARIGPLIHWKECGNMQLSGYLEQIDGLVNAQLEDGGQWSVMCNPGSTSIFLVFNGKVKSNVQVHGQIAARTAFGFPDEGCESYHVNLDYKAAMTVDIQIMMQATDTTNASGLPGIELEFSSPIVIASHPSMTSESIAGSLAAAGLELCAIPLLTILCPAIAGGLAYAAHYLYSMLEKKIAENFENPITPTIAGIPNVFLPFISVADLCGLRTDVAVVPPTHWPCLPGAASAGSFGSAVEAPSWMVPCDAPGNACVMCAGTTASCGLLPGLCNFGCFPVCNVEKGVCCGSQQVCLGSSDPVTASCCTPVCADCQTGSDGCGGQCHLKCMDPAQTCGTGSASGQCVTTVDAVAAAGLGTGTFVARALASPRHGPMFLSQGPAPQPLYFQDRVPVGATLTAIAGFPAFVQFTPTAAGSTTYALSVGFYVAGTGGLDRNPETFTIPLVVVGSPPASDLLVVTGQGAPLQVTITPAEPGPPPTYFLTAVLAGQTYTMTNVAGNVGLVAGPPTPGSVHWLVGGCNTDADCGSQQYCGGVVCVTPGGNAGGSSWSSESTTVSYSGGSWPPTGALGGSDTTPGGVSTSVGLTHNKQAVIVVVCVLCGVAVVVAVVLGAVFATAKRK